MPAELTRGREIYFAMYTPAQQYWQFIVIAFPMKTALLAFSSSGRDFIFIKLFIQLLRLADNAALPDV